MSLYLCIVVFKSGCLMTEISSISTTSLNLPQMTGVSQTEGAAGCGSLFGDNIIGGAEDSYTSDGMKSQLKLQAQNLVKLAKRINSSNSEGTEGSESLKKSLDKKLKALKEQAENAGVDLNALFSEIAQEMNLSRKDQKMLGKTLKVKISKKTDTSSETSGSSVMSQPNPFGSTTSSRTLFPGMAGLTSTTAIAADRPTSGSVEAIRPWAADGNYNREWWQKLGYNESKGQALLQNGKRWSDYAQSQGVKAQCGGYVRRALNDTYGTNFTRFGKACDTGNDYLSQMPQLKKIDVSNMKLKPSDIPPGAIVIYGPGYSNGAGRVCGHIEISDGNGSGYSDLKTHLLSNWGQRREPQEIWIPV